MVRVRVCKGGFNGPRVEGERGVGYTEGGISVYKTGGRSIHVSKATITPSLNTNFFPL